MTTVWGQSSNMLLTIRNADGKVTQEEFVQTCLGKLFRHLEFNFVFKYFSFQSTLNSVRCSTLSLASFFSE